LARLDDGCLREGAKLIEKLKKKHRNHVYVIFAMGVLAAKQEHIDEAIGHFTNAVELNPDFVEAHFNLGVAYKKKVKVPEFVASFRKVLEMGEPDDDVVDQARLILDQTEQSIHKTDGVDLDTYIRAHQFFDHGVMQMNTENWEAAIAKFEASNKLIDDHAQTYGNLGLCHAKLGNHQTAIEAFDKALEIDPKYELALLNRELTRTLDDDQSLSGKIKTVEYYRDYANGKRSYIEEFASDHHLLPDKR
jgi:tetratricopeptide (TPR) repeat protein